jgi:hypothetical protein
MATEADTCSKFVVPKPKLQAKPAGWDSDPQSVAEQRCFTDGRIVARDVLPRLLSGQFSVTI